MTGSMAVDNPPISAAPRLRCSVIMPTYNRAPYLRRAIDSVLGQQIAGDELIVVDDGSTDDTDRVLADYEGRIRVVAGAHRGAGPARNLGISVATGDLVAFLDSDDEWLSGKLELQRRLMEAQPGLLFCFGNFEVEYAGGKRCRHFLERWPRTPQALVEALGQGRPYSTLAPLPLGASEFPVYEADFYDLQMTGFYVLTDTLVVRREAAGAALRFAEDLPTYEDLECFYRLARQGAGALLDADLARQFEHADGRLSDRSGLEKLDARLALLRRHWGQDEDYLRRHRKRYQSVLEALLAEKAGHLISQGDAQGARATLREMQAPPVALRLMSRAPSFVTLAALHAYRYARRRGRADG